MALFIGLDSGTQSLTAIVIEAALHVRRTVLELTLSFDQALPSYGTRHGVLPNDNPHVVTAPPLMWAEALDRMMEQIARAGVNLADLRAIAGSAQQPGSVYLNAGAAATLATSDGRSMAFAYNRDIWLLSRDGKTERLVTSAGAISAQADFSPDDRWLAYSTFPLTTTSSVRQVYVQPYPALDRRVQVSTDNGSGPAWRQDGRELYYAEDASAGGPLRIRVMAVPITTTPRFSAGTPRVLFEGPLRIEGPFRGYDVTPDGQRFLMVREVPQQPARVSQLVLVQNWLEELKRLVPAN